MTRDWLRWHEDYDTPGSSLARRLAVVRRYLGRALTEAPAGPDGHRSLISLCAGDGRDVLPVLARHDAGRQVRAVLAELDPELAGRARSAAGRLGLAEVDVRTGDAGLADVYLDAAPAHVVMVCGVFGNISREDVSRTIAALPALSAAGGFVIWTRGRGTEDTDPSSAIRAELGEHGFAEIAFEEPADARFRVGMHRLIAAPVPARRLSGGRLFAFA
ncbi:class I SAM-dependent methyltransferase [Actinoplanes xinjiangensis]|uniref:class I SAM-dependent methyltransferase n=1 Tax=Actinoplanes xinjiangensis TaxID=512350 RepID=UPI00342FEEEE